MVEINSGRLLQDLKIMRNFGAFKTGVIRPAFSNSDMTARKWLRDRMAQAGLDVDIDGVGNVLGKSKNEGKAVLIGSHTDTQPQGGWLDGTLGVLYGLEVMRAFSEYPETSVYPIDVASWSDEEGTYLSMLGSNSFCGTITLNDIQQAVHYLSGDRLEEAIKKAGLAGRELFHLNRTRYLAYLEAHIEQGPHLEHQAMKIGVVTAIVGLRTFKISFLGEQNHAGTTPMEYRKDAASTLVGFAHRIDQKLKKVASTRTVWTIGDIRVTPGSPSVVPGKAEMYLQFRDTDEHLLDKMEEITSSLAENFNKQRQVSVEIEPVLPHQKSVRMDSAIQELLISAAEMHAQGRWISIPSGAGHDAQIIAPHLPTGMLFIPSIGGISHDIAEDCKEEDIVRGCQTLAMATKTLFTKSNQLNHL